jgi:hypothetical protein
VEQNRLSRLIGFTRTDDLGKYLGMPLIRGRVTNRTYEDLIHTIDARLTGWQADRLSFAGRITLAKLVLSAIPSYAMQTTKLSKTVCEEIDKKIRKFV